MPAVSCGSNSSADKARLSTWRDLVALLCMPSAALRLGPERAADVARAPSAVAELSCKQGGLLAAGAGMSLVHGNPPVAALVGCFAIVREVGKAHAHVHSLACNHLAGLLCRRSSHGAHDSCSHAERHLSHTQAGHYARPAGGWA